MDYSEYHQALPCTSAGSSAKHWYVDSLHSCKLYANRLVVNLQHTSYSTLLWNTSIGFTRCELRFLWYPSEEIQVWQHDTHLQHVGPVVVRFHHLKLVQCPRLCSRSELTCGCSGRWAVCSWGRCGSHPCSHPHRMGWSSIPGCTWWRERQTAL